MRMKKHNLIVVAGVVWMAAGANVAVLGARAATGMSGTALAAAVALIAGAVATFLEFHMIFSRLVVKNSRRIRLGTDFTVHATLPSFLPSPPLHSLLINWLIQNPLP